MATRQSLFTTKFIVSDKHYNVKCINTRYLCSDSSLEEWWIYTINCKIQGVYNINRCSTLFPINRVSLIIFDTLFILKRKKKNNFFGN